ncbi:MAG: polyisoprenoid-binding protein [Thermoflavifilum sp.]|nr:polyisoprenoid-binding protein [Thermoflavifilum sp.]MCL6512984.1 YceI family protein [Alicyclobacillus sp.]
MAKEKWVLDATHSNVDFTVRHMMIATVRGAFHKFDANIVADPEDLTTAEIEFTVDVASVDTRNEDRDNHLRSADFFDAEHYPQMTFKATRIVRTGDGEYDMTGDLTIRGVTKPVTLHVVYGGGGKDPWGNQRVGFTVTGKVNRKDFGLTWNVALETGGVLVSDEVQIHIDLQAVKAA